MFNSNGDFSPSNSNFWRLRVIILSRASLAVASLLLVGIMGGTWRLWSFIKQDLTPLATHNLTKTLNRPVKLGHVASFSLTGVNFAASEIPATASDPDKVSIKSVAVRFDIWRLIFKRHLLLDVTLINPNVYVEQDDQGRWLTTTIASREPSAWIRTDLDKLRFRDARLILVPNAKWRGGNSANIKLTSVGFGSVNGSAKLLENNRLIRLDIMAQSNHGGDIVLQGDLIPNSKSLAGDFRLRSQNLFAEDITRIVGLPVNLQSGKVNGDLKIKATPDQPTLLYGSAVLNNVNIAIPGLPQLLNNCQGNISFDGLKIKLDNLVTNYGKIPLIASGIIDQKAGFNIQGKVNAVSLSNAQSTLNVKLPVPVSGIAKADLQLLGTIKQPILSGVVSTVKVAQVDKIDFEKINSKFDLKVGNNDSSILKITDIQGLAVVGGEIKGEGIIKLGKDPQLNFNFTAANVPGDAIAKIYNININDPKNNLKPSWKIGTVSAKVSLTGTAKNAQTLVKWTAPQGTYPATGTTIINSDRTVNFENVQAKVGGGLVTAKGSYFNQNWQFITQSSGIKLISFINKNQEQNINLNGAEFNGSLRLSGKTQPFLIEKITPENANVNIAGGKVNVKQLELKDNQFNVELIAKNLYLSKIINNANPILNNPLMGIFFVSGNREDFSLQTLNARGSAQLNPQQGIINIDNIQVSNGNYQAKIQANNISFPTLPGIVTGELQIAGIVESFKPENITGYGAGKVKLANGNITASNIKISQGNYQALLTIPGLKLTEFHQKLQGNLFGKLQIAGSLNTPKLSNVITAGRIGWSDDQGINTQADIGWNGQRLIINNVGNGKLQANGYILANAKKPGIPEITDFKLQIQAINYDLQKLPVTLPQGVKIAGGMDFSGEISGIPAAPNILGKIGLNNFQVSHKIPNQIPNQPANFVFEPVLNGKIEGVSGQGFVFDIAGKKDRLAVNLDKNNRPQSFLLQWQEAVAKGQFLGNNGGSNWGIKLANFPLDKLNLALPQNTLLSPGGVQGLLTADLRVNQNTLATVGNVEIIQPELGRIKGDRLTTQFQYHTNNNTAIFTNSQFTKKDSIYNFNATINQLTTKPQIQANINIQKGQIQDILRTAQIFEIEDIQRGIKAPNYGKASDLTINSQGLPNEDLFTQIQRLSEIDTLISQDEKKRLEAKIIPDLKDLQGQFNGNISIDTHKNQTLILTFDLQGKDFVWGRKEETGRFYRAERVIVKGGFEQGIFQFKPLRIETKNKLINFAGNIGGEKQSGQLQVRNFPIEILPLELLNNVVKLPGEITGNLNLTATLAGTINNPQGQGNLEISQGTIDQKPVKSATSSFNYSNGRLIFDSNVLGIGTGNEPANINGSIPYNFPGSLAANKDDITLNVNIKNEGLTLLNLFTNQINFEEGKGELRLEVRGNKKQPLVKGKAILDNATFSAQALPGKLTNVTGNTQFDLTKVLVENLQGKFSNGKIEVQGELPISSNQTVTIENPLTVNLQQLVLNFQGLYQGGASGNLQITGSLLQPVIGGKIELFDGKVLLSESTNTNSSSLSSNDVNNNVNVNRNIENQLTKLNNLELTLGKNVEIASPPVFSFQAIGDLKVNGSLANPIPEGTIQLTKGGVNLFTTQLNLARNQQHTATFSSRNPRDPYLNIRLFAKVLDIVQNFDLSRQNSPGLAGLETVRVEASIDGLGSQINENLELKSIPSRSQTEIVTLLGGGFLDTQGRADSRLGLINIAGAAVFNNFQTAFSEIGTAFGLSELRMFPTVVSEKPTATGNNSSLELALEAGVDVSSKLSVSIIKILTANDPLQWGFNYRINNELRLRSSTNLTDDGRIVFEFERRF
ncbi:translocation/assembly module TamB domain-containing protein [Anabaena sp. FACHB-1237]|uniref:translocation/assembly module TamB domain-containing protein n=1 Tax=Anabaena sp. FACHB-1237 TaxID=2692769 RepID=UPI0016807415|nr:translocation/assembly module TamB [Anabaena sp. FACHB-1237]MBD2138966.1 translocation/assembly module TamB domain-containing protein [Anabaena sp. FACHB-1237]